MKKLFVGILALLAVSTSALAADQRVSGYTRKDGTYVAPHYRTSPNSTTSDNYSTRGNANPYTGETGTKPDTRPGYGSYTRPTYQAPRSSGPYGSTPAPAYGSKPKAPCTSLYGC